ncbi:MAG: glycosyltransferase family 4 protein [Promethearchaeota archaeon]
MNKICFVSSKLDGKGSVSTYTIELTRRLRKKYDICILTGIFQTKLPSDIKIHKRPDFFKSQDLNMLANGLLNTVYSKKIKKKYGIDVLHTQFLNSLNTDVVTFHGCILEHYKRVGYKETKTHLQKLRFWMEKYAERKIVRNSKKIIAVSEGLKRELLKYYPLKKDKIRVIPNGVDIKKYAPNLKKRKEIRNELNIDKREIVLVCTGSNFHRKGLKKVILALPKLPAYIKIIAVGGGNLTPYKQLASKLGVADRVIFTGFVPRIEDYYCAGDIFVFPSLYEAFSLATLEAAASGLPIIATKINGTEELIKEGYNGFFVKRDPEDIAEKINMLIKDENLRKQMGRNARKLVEKNYTWDICAKKTAEVYEEVLRR